MFTELQALQLKKDGRVDEALVIMKQIKTLTYLDLEPELDTEVRMCMYDLLCIT